MPELLAQSDAAIPGWGTAVGIMGLLTGLLYWLLYVHIPETRKEIKELIVAHQNIEQKQRSDFQEALSGVIRTNTENEKEQRKDFKDALNVLVLSHKEQIQGLANAIKEDLASIEKKIEYASRMLGEETRKP